MVNKHVTCSFLTNYYEVNRQLKKKHTPFLTVMNQSEAGLNQLDQLNPTVTGASN